MSLYNSYNNENILIRAVIAGLLDVLNNQIKYEQVWSNDDKEIISVPWFYAQSGDQRFMTDLYTFYASCLPPKPIDGNFDMIPRGAIKYTGSSIVSSRITSRYVQGRYMKEVNNQLESYVSYLYSLPLSVRIECEMWIDTHITALKIEQQLRETFYRTLTYYSYYKGMRIGSTVGFPDDITIDKNITFSHDADNKIKLTFQLEIETYQPVFDPTTEMKASNKIKGFNYNLYPIQEKQNKNIIIPTTPQTGAVIPKGTPIWLEWIANEKGSIINKVNLQWALTGTNDLSTIELSVDNHEYYIWNIPSNFTDFKDPVIIFEETDNVKISRKPVLKIVPDINTKAITSSSFKLIDEGYFISTDDASINIQLEMKNDNGVISYSTDGTIWANIKSNVIDYTNPVTVTDSSLIFPGSLSYKDIDVIISSANDSKVNGVINNITIV